MKKVGRFVALTLLAVSAVVVVWTLASTWADAVRVSSPDSTGHIPTP